ncbi:SIS domain-containing protein [Culicoidibacter larvae]|uniref:MurR/RpiR family transcriptional regulator n=1 Tax=Culicoidibacter larvae TaxID=2579976 RepID=A0A5R8QHE3_9FIRM|nr:SIS domain-containing protein [Culicoidibacter larvae]TLG76687.1 MurR/RpiR family transcriptional regulator [Culicoidibacter larvae]
MSHTSPASLQKDDLVILISASGSTGTIISTATQLHYKHIKTLAITNKIDTPLHQLVTAACSTNIPEHIYNGFDISARSLIMFILDLIFNFYVQLNQNKN